MGRGGKKPSYFKLKPSEAHTTDEMLKVFHSEEVKGTLNCDLYVEVRFFFFLNLNHVQLHMGSVVKTVRVHTWTSEREDKMANQEKQEQLGQPTATN